MLYVSIAVVFLCGMYACNAAAFWCAAGARITLGNSFKVVVVAAALNRLLFTGVGFAVSSAASIRFALPASQALAAFVLVEVFSTGPWIAAGVYFGARITAAAPVIIIGIFAAALAYCAIRGTKVRARIQQALQGLRVAGRRAAGVMCCAVFAALCLTGYYVFLFYAFGFFPGIIQAIQIVAVAFTAGYLSPAPAGLGFKETGMVYMLANAGVPVKEAVIIALWDRIIVTAVAGILASVSGFDMLRAECARRRAAIKQE